MTLVRGLAIGVFAAGVLMLPAAQSETRNVQISGQWTLTQGRLPDQVQLTLHWKSSQHTMNSTMAWSLDRIEGLSTAQLKSAETAVQFRIKREAGTLNCEGFLKGGSGGGVFSFVVNRGFVEAMSSLGYSGLRDDQVLAMAIHDVTTSYVKDMRAEGIQIASADQLLAMKIHNVTIAYVRAMKQLGFSGLSSDRLIAMRIHGVTPEFARDLKQLGYTSVTTEQMIAMRIHGVTPELIQKLQKRGLKDLSIANLISLRIHGVVN